ncbi:MAG: hypothetical protein H7329_13200 [Opitutaceae bacterium]|nr:hypothetical protein [Cytophagales bacterium]
MKQTNITSILISALFIILLSSCRKVFDKTQWSPEASFPIAYADLSIGNLVTDTSQLKTDSSGLAVLVLKQKLDSLSLSVLDTFSVPPFYRKFKLDSLVLTVPPFIQKFTLGDLATSLINSGDQQNALYGYALRFFQGKPLSSIPTALPSTLSFPLGNLPLSLNQFFESAELKTGTLDLTINNQFPLKISRMDFSIRNASDMAVLIQENGIALDVNSTFSKSYDLAGKKVDGNLLINIPILDLITDKNAIIDTNSSIEVKMIFSNLTVNSATAVFPDQDVVTDRRTVSLENMKDLELREAIIDEGNMVMDVVSTIQDSIYITYSIPKTTQNGIPLVFNGVVPPATATKATNIQLKVPIKNYLFNLSTAPDYFNSFYYDFRAHVKNTGKKVYLNLTDSIEVNVYLKSVRPKYVRGYLGSLDTTIKASVNTDLFSKINVQQLSPENVKLSLKVENGLGVNGEVRFESLKATNQYGEVVTATDPQLIGQDFTIPAATNPPFMETNTTLKSSNTSNFANLVSILPNKLDYQVHAKVGGLPKDSNNFVFNTSKLKPILLIEVPLNISVQGLILRDTISVNSSQIGLETNGGVLRLLSYNGFPFFADIKATFISNTGGTLVLNGIGRMEAADIDPVSGKVLAQKFSKIEFRFDPSQLEFINTSQKMILEAQFNTPPDKKVKIYSDYAAHLSLTAKISPKVSR